MVLIWQICIYKGGPKWAGLLRSEGIGHVVRDSCKMQPLVFGLTPLCLEDGVGGNFCLAPSVTVMECQVFSLK